MADVVVAAHQPNYLPWLGFFYKLALSDVFILLDGVQFSKGGYTNRCTIRNNDRKIRLSVPVSRVGHFEAIADKTVTPARFRRKHLETLRQAYAGASHLDEVMAILEPLYDGGTMSLAAFNTRLIKAIHGYLNLGARLVLQSELGVTGRSDELLSGLARAVGGTVYVAGAGGRKYSTGREGVYTGAGIALAHMLFEEPEAGRGGGRFLPGLSVVDALCHLGRDARALLSPQADPPWTVAAAPGGT